MPEIPPTPLKLSHPADEWTRLEGLPAVEGNRLPISIGEFAKRSLILLDEEQSKPNPDNALVAHLCNAVRFVREHAYAVGRYLGEVNADMWTCPSCAFTFDAAHTDEPEGGYSCPCCRAVALEKEREELRVEVASALSDCVTLAKLCDEEPQFSNPLAVVDAMNRRDFYLRQAATLSKEAANG